MERLRPGALDGIQHTEEVELEAEGRTYFTDIRPLKHSEAKRVQKILSGAVHFRGKATGRKRDRIDADVELNSGDFVEARYNAQLKAAALGTVDDFWNEETIDAEWLSEWIAKVGERVMEISGIDADLDDDEGKENGND